MWFAVAIIGIIAIATGVTLLPSNQPTPAPPASSAAAPQTPAQSTPGAVAPAQK